MSHFWGLLAGAWMKGIWLLQDLLRTGLCTGALFPLRMSLLTPPCHIYPEGAALLGALSALPRVALVNLIN